MLHFFWRHMRRGEGGFTLIELLIVVAIIAILAAILIPNFLRARAQSMVSASKGNLKNLGTALESYFVDNGQYPQPAGGVPTALAPTYTRAVPLDPCAKLNYIYSAPGAPAQTYQIETPSWTTTPCAGILTGLFYTPAGGLGETP